MYFLTVQIDGQTVPAILSPVRPAVAPRLLSGRGLDRPGQVVLGPATLRQLHQRVGDTVDISIALAAIAALILANLVAALPGQAAARTRAALVLRSE